MNGESPHCFFFFFRTDDMGILEIEGEVHRKMNHGDIMKYVHNIAMGFIIFVKLYIHT